MGERRWQQHSQPRKPDWLCPTRGRVWGGVAAVRVSVGGVLFSLVAWQLPGYWGISLSCWLGLSGPVWGVEATGSLRHDYIPPSGPAGTLGPRARLGRWAGQGGAVGRLRAHPEGPQSGDWVGPLEKAVAGRWGGLRKTLFLSSVL